MRMVCIYGAHRHTRGGQRDWVTGSERSRRALWICLSLGSNTERERASAFVFDGFQTSIIPGAVFSALSFNLVTDPPALPPCNTDVNYKGIEAKTKKGFKKIKIARNLFWKSWNTLFLLFATSLDR